MCEGYSLYDEAWKSPDEEVMDDGAVNGEVMDDGAVNGEVMDDGVECTNSQLSQCLTAPGFVENPPFPEELILMQ